MRNEIVALALAVMIFVSTVFSCLPLVSAAYTVEEHYMPPDSDDLDAICAMKTLTSGYFYKPNMALDLVKIELLFDNSNLVGDQTGGTSPYANITNYPDGTVDMRDLWFVSVKFGRDEGHPEFDYMADIVPDRTIDMLDKWYVSKNYGKYGTYITDLTGVTVLFNTGEQKSPDSDGFVTIPQSATNFTVKRNGTPIGAMVIFYGPREPPIAYSTTFDFTVPDDGNNEVWYYVLARVYVPEALSGQNFYFVATADDRVQNVKLNAYSKAGSGSSVNINLGILAKGYHLLEFEFVEIIGSGSLNFHVATANGDYAWLSRFRTYVPNYSDTEYRYTVKTHTYFPISDRYFIKGFADDYIDDIKLGGGWLYQDWQWSSYWTAIYAWGDGFNVPCGYLDPADWRDIELIYGVMSGGILDFQILSFTEQPDKIAKGTPEFWASVMALAGFSVQLKDKKLYAGSQWYSDPGLSERKIVVSQEIYFAMYRDVSPYDLFWDAKVRFDVGIIHLDPIINSETSFGIAVNVTYLGGVEKPTDCIWANEVSMQARVPIQAVNVVDWEYKDIQGGKSIVNQNFKIATGMSIAVATTLAASYGLPVGAMVGLVAAGAMVTGIFNFVKDEQEAPFKYQGYADNYASASIDSLGSVNTGQSVSEVGFVRVKPAANTHCGFVEVYVRGSVVGGWMGATDHVDVFTTIRFPVYVP
jgi:hypothetical protein